MPAYRITAKFFLFIFIGVLMHAGLLAQSVYKQKMSPAAQVLCGTFPNQGIAAFQSGELPFLLAVSPGFQKKHAQQLGIQVNAVCGDVWSCRATADQIRQLVLEPGVVYVDMHLPYKVQPMDDSARKASRIEEAWLADLPQRSIKGKNVVLGIIDVGFQTDHPGFWDATGNTYRVKRFWNQGTGAGPAPQGFTYGRECKTEAEILAERNDDGTHGTHVAGIAGGSGLGSPGLKYAGVAPESDLVFVNIRYSSPTLPGSALGDYVIANPAIIDGYDYVLRYANATGRSRAVTNLSWGMYTGPHDGTSLFDRAVDDLATRGLVVVGAAGNYGNNPMHLRADLRGDTAYTFAIDNNRRNRTRESIYTDIWGSPGKTFQVNAALVDSFGNVLFETPFFGSNGSAIDRWFTNAAGDSLQLILAMQESYPFNGKPNILLIAAQNRPSKNYIRLGLTADSSTLHAWNSGEAWLWSSGSFRNVVRGNNFAGIYLNGDSEHTVGENGGTGNNTITVGAYVTRNVWTDDRDNPRNSNEILGRFASFTSRGPRVDGMVKPDVSAPGSEICAPLHNRQLPGWLFDRVLCRDSIKGAWNYYGVLSGTSMASPHVAGIAALMLEVNPELSPALLKQILIQTVKTADSSTGTLPSVRLGWGKVDAFQALNGVKTLGLSKNNLHPEQFRLWPNPANGGGIHILAPETWLGDKQVRITDMSGRLLMQQTFAGGDLQIELPPGLKTGLYHVQIIHGNHSASRLLLIP